MFEGGTGGLSYIDQATMRRTSTGESGYHKTTASQLARAFSVVVRQVADLLTMMQDYNVLAPGLPKGPGHLRPGSK